jgi:hypothetical protein
MNVQPYTEASGQRLQLRRELRQRLQQISEATAALGAAAPGVEAAPVEPLPREALAHVEPLCSVARSLTKMLRRNQSDIAAVEQALRVARARAQRVRWLAAGLGVLAVLTAVAVLLLRPV